MEKPEINEPIDFSAKKIEKTDGKKDNPQIDENLIKTILKAMEYANKDPETSLMYARKSAEAICLNIFALAIRTTKTTKLDDSIKNPSRKGYTAGEN